MPDNTDHPSQHEPREVHGEPAGLAESRREEQARATKEALVRLLDDARGYVNQTVAVLRRNGASHGELDTACATFDIAFQSLQRSLTT